MKINWIKYAALATVLLVLPFSCTNDVSPTSLFDANFEAPDAVNLYTARSVPEGSEEKKPEKDNAAEVSNSAKGIKAYNAKQYSEAIQYFSAYVDMVGTKNDDIQFYLGVSYLANNQLNQAEEVFEKLTKEGVRSRKSESEWYLVLTLLKSNQLDATQKNIAKILKKKKHPYYQKALSLQQKIDKHLQK